jgi:hypothetical protein
MFIFMWYEDEIIDRFIKMMIYYSYIFEITHMEHKSFK